MTEHEKQQRTALRQEIRARKLVVKRLEHPLALARAAGEKKKAEREARLEALGEYKTFNDAQEAYGFGMITETEFDQIVDFLENKEQMKSVRSPEEHAADILQEYIIGLEREIASFEFDMLPQKEQKRIRQQNFELLERRKKRMSGGTI
ncbi:MAG: hypothetical protein IIV61_07120 [Oscillospiraceae bacterium]|nr:hypothetical protein [Oscillospiraceae bacterium]